MKANVTGHASQRKNAVAVFILFLLSVVAAYFYYQPSWGVMDDFQVSTAVQAVWHSDGNFGRALGAYLHDDFMGQKMRPIFSLYALFIYKVFENFPTGAYICIFVVLLSIFPLWGRMLCRMFGLDPQTRPDVVYVFPLAFFIFTPFWNNFMYISLQEKLIFFFGTFGFSFFMRAYAEEKRRYVVWSLAFALLALLSKPTGIFVLLTFMFFAGVDIVFIRQKIKLSLSYVGSGLLIVALFYLLMKMVVVSGGYSFKYVQNCSPLGIIKNIFQASVAIKALLFVAGIYFCFVVSHIRKGTLSALTLIPPLGFLAYILVLAPWGIINYLLAPVGPFVISMFLPCYLAATKRFNKTRWSLVPVAAVIGLVFVMLAAVIIPRISKMADIRKVMTQIIALNADRAGVAFYFPPPFMETGDALKNFSRANVKYLRDGTLSVDKFSSKENFLLFCDQCADVLLDGVGTGKTIYENNTWKILELQPAPGYRGQTHIELPVSILQKIIIKIRNSS